MSDPDALVEALHRLLEPLAEILIRNGVPHAAFAEVAKQAEARLLETAQRAVELDNSDARSHLERCPNRRNRLGIHKVGLL